MHSVEALILNRQERRCAMCMLISGMRDAKTYFVTDSQGRNDTSEPRVLVLVFPPVKNGL